MASISNLIALIIFTFSVLSLSHADKKVENGCMTTSVKDICDTTMFPSSCYKNLNSIINSNITQSQDMLKQSIKNSMNQLSIASPNFDPNGTLGNLITTTMPNNALALSVLYSCQQLLSLSMTNLNNSLYATDLNFTSDETSDNLKSWICAAGTDLQTCLEGFNDLSFPNVTNLVYDKLKSSIAGTSDIRAIMDRIDKCSNSEVKKIEFLSHEDKPFWLSFQERRLIEDSKVNADVIVAKDGSGKYTRIMDAVKAVPGKSNKRFVIYVKKGVYYENVRVEEYHWNVMMIGDGMYETTVSGSFSHVGGKNTFDSATFAVFGQGFIARDMGFVNTAGPAKGQAVALLSGSDKSVFYKCHFEGYQDTLFILSHRQFYRECHIYGTIDFIFGGASAVIQKSTIRVKRPLHGQKNTITAHFKTDQKCETAIVIQKSNIEQSEDLAGAMTYLGRPWTNYSTTVFMQNNMQSLIDPKGWLQWNDRTPANTIYFGEYSNIGPGANVANRVKWGGVRAKLSNNEADKFTVRSLIQGDRWLPATFISFDSGII